MQNMIRDCFVSPFETRRYGKNCIADGISGIPQSRIQYRRIPRVLRASSNIKLRTISQLSRHVNLLRTNTSMRHKFVITGMSAILFEYAVSGTRHYELRSHAASLQAKSDGRLYRPLAPWCCGHALGGCSLPSHVTQSLVRPWKYKGSYHLPAITFHILTSSQSIAIFQYHSTGSIIRSWNDVAKCTIIHITWQTPPVSTLQASILAWRTCIENPGVDGRIISNWSLKKKQDMRMELILLRTEAGGVFLWTR